MKRQLLPLLLCHFVILFAISNSVFANNNFKQYKNIRTDSQVFNFLNKDSFQGINHYASTSNLLNQNFYIESVFQYNSDLPLTNGISLAEENSYNNIKKKTQSSATILTPIPYKGNLFNQGLFYGFALTVVLLNLVCFFVFDEILFVKFSAVVAGSMIALFYTEGLFPLVGIDGIYENQIMQSILLFFAIGLHCLFADKYLTIKEHYPMISQVSLSTFGVAFLLVITSWINGNEVLANIANITMFATLSIYFLAGVLLFSKKNYAKFYVIGTFIPLLFSIDYFVLNPFGIDFLFTEPVHLKVAVLFEVLLLSYAILYRMQAVKEEGELRQTEMRIFLKRQDVMTRNQVELLVEDVYLENLIMQYDLDGLEIKLLQYISEGKENAKIARKLKLTETEVVDHTKDLYKKLEISEHIQEDYRLLDNQPDYIYN